MTDYLCGHLMFVVFLSGDSGIWSHLRAEPYSHLRMNLMRTDGKVQALLSPIGCHYLNRQRRSKMSRLIDVDALAKWLGKTYEPPYKLDGDEINSLRWPIDIAQQTDIWKERLMEFATDINVHNNGWISVKDRLPERKWIDCLVATRIQTDGTRGVNIAWLNDDNGVWSSNDKWICDGREIVTHWMPLPEPPKEEA